MAPKKQSRPQPPPPPRRVSKAAVAAKPKPPNPNSLNANNVAIQSLPNVVVSPSPSPSASVTSGKTTGTAPVSIDAGTSANSSFIQKKQDERAVDPAGNETLGDNTDNSNEVMGEMTPNKKKKTVKKVVVKVVKKIVKKRVPKSMIINRELENSAVSSTSTKDEVSDNNEGDGGGGEEDVEKVGIEEIEEDKKMEKLKGEVLDSDRLNDSDLIDVGLPFSVEEAFCMGVNSSQKNGTVPQKSDSVDHSENVQLVRNGISDGVVRKSDSAAKMPAAENVHVLGDDNNMGGVQNSDSAAGMPMAAAKTELVLSSDNNGAVLISDSATEMTAQKSNSAPEMITEAVNEDSVKEIDEERNAVDLELVQDRINEGEAQISKSTIESPMEVENAEARNNPSAVQKSEMHIDADLDGDRNYEGVAQAVASSSGYEEGVKGNSDAGKGGIALSGELGALERRRRRRTEIFIGGLCTDAKEEDVRKVFGEVGEIAELRLVVNNKTGKNKGYAFVRYASASDAKRALEKYAKIEICGKLCSTAPVEGNDTIFLGQIDKKWTDKDITRLLQEIGVEKIDTVTVMANPSNMEHNRGFAFVEFATQRDAQIAFKKLQKKDPGKLQNVKVAWAQPISEPNEEEVLKVKSVYAEYLPPSWDEEKLRSYFTKFGEIENIVLSRNLHSSRRKDFAFINFETREAALACIESLNHEMLSDEGSQVNVKVSLARPLPKGKTHKKVSTAPRKEISKQKHVTKNPVKPIEPKRKEIPTIHINSQRADDVRSPGPSELEQRLAERALRKQMQGSLSTGFTNVDYSHVLPGQKRSFLTLGDDLSYSDLREQTRRRVEVSYPIGSVSRGEVSPVAGTMPYSHYQQLGADYGLGHRYTDYANNFQRQEDPYHGTGRGQYRY